MEIERKWLIKEMPEHLEEWDRLVVRQCYISTNPEIRLRESSRDFGTNVTYFITCKGDGTLSREENEMEITEQEYEVLRKFVSKKDIVKYVIIYVLPNGRKLICNDVDLEEGKEPFMYAEVEFKSEDEANKFELPFEAVEVTNDPHYKMKNYWKRTRGE